VVRRRRYCVDVDVRFLEVWNFCLQGGFWALTRALRDVTIVRGLSGILSDLIWWESFVGR